MSCLFRALSRFVEGDSEQLLRQKICNFLILDFPMAHAAAEQFVQWESGLDLVTYTSRMRDPSVWGGATEIQVFCEMYNFVVVVKNIRDAHAPDMTFTPRSCLKGAVRTACISWNGGHYEPVLTDEGLD
jgi:hypothetical protein